MYPLTAPRPRPRFEANSYFTVNEPWKLKPGAEGENPARLGAVLWSTLECLRVAGVLLQPVIPDAAARMLTHMGVPEAARTASHARVVRGAALDKAEPRAVGVESATKKFVLFPQAPKA